MKVEASGGSAAQEPGFSGYFSKRSVVNCTAMSRRLTDQADTRSSLSAVAVMCRIFVRALLKQLTFRTGTCPMTLGQGGVFGAMHGMSIPLSDVTEFHEATFALKLSHRRAMVCPKGSAGGRWQMNLHIHHPKSGNRNSHAKAQRRKGMGLRREGR